MVTAFNLWTTMGKKAWKRDSEGERVWERGREQLREKKQQNDHDNDNEKFKKKKMKVEIQTIQQAKWIDRVEMVWDKFYMSRG